MNSDYSLPPAVVLEKSRLSPVLRRDLADLTKRDPRSFLAQLVFAWAVIAGTMWWAATAKSFAVSLIAVIIIATRQNVLGLLVHEQAHCLAFKAWPGDLIANLLAAYPLLIVTVEGYAGVHLRHHRFYFTDRDPDFVRKNGSDWATPMPKGRLIKLFLTDIFGLNLISLIKGKRSGSADSQFCRATTPRLIRPAFYLLAATAITLARAWPLVLQFWILPLVTVLQVIIRLGALTEHRHNLRGAEVEHSTPLIVPLWWERLLLPNLNFTYHAYHHFFPGIPFSKLPDVHRMFCEQGMVTKNRVFHGYAAYLKFATSSQTPRTEPGAVKRLGA